MTILFLNQYCTEIKNFAGLLYPLGPTVVEFTPGESVTLEVDVADTFSSMNFRSLRWFANATRLTSAGRFSISDDGKALTIKETVEEDVGVYDAKFTGLVLPGYNRKCESALLDLLRPYPFGSPVSFQLSLKGIYFPKLPSACEIETT